MSYTTSSGLKVLAKFVYPKAYTYLDASGNYQPQHGPVTECHIKVADYTGNIVAESKGVATRYLGGNPKPDPENMVVARRIALKRALNDLTDVVNPAEVFHHYPIRWMKPDKKKKTVVAL